MVRPPDAEIARLRQIARDVREVADDAGYLVGIAVGQHIAFSRTRGPAGALERALVLDAARAAASQAGLWPEDVQGGGLDIVAHSDGTFRRYRVKTMKVTAEGEYRVICGQGSSLLEWDDESLYRQERWVLGYIVSDDHTIETVIAGEVIGWRGTGPVYLQLGLIIDLGGDQPPAGFTSADEGLDGFDDEDADGDIGNVDGF